jgi:hypothetical protein
MQFYYPLKRIISVTYGSFHLCGLVVRFPGYRYRDSGSIPDATSLSEK